MTPDKPVSEEWKPDLSLQRIVCAAVTFERGMLIGPRHWDTTMQKQMEQCGGFGALGEEADQGFIDQWGQYLTREQAYEVAVRQGQIRHKSGNPNSPTLYSEDIY